MCGVLTSWPAHLSIRYPFHVCKNLILNSEMQIISTTLITTYTQSFERVLLVERKGCERMLLKANDETVKANKHISNTQVLYHAIACHGVNPSPFAYLNLSSTFYLQPQCPFSEILPIALRRTYSPVFHHWKLYQDVLFRLKVVS